jgi:beta-N-acetylhexosaminidase
VAGALYSGRLDRAAMQASRQRIDIMHHRDATRTSTSLPAATESVELVGLAAASRALRIEGDVPISPGGHIIECRPDANLAIGTTGWGLVAGLGATGWFGQQLHPDQQPDCSEIAQLPGSLVVVVRDAARDDWQQSVINNCAHARPDVIVVEMGWPSPLPISVTQRICTFGASRACSTAVLQRLIGASSTLAPGSDTP